MYIGVGLMVCSGLGFIVSRVLVETLSKTIPESNCNPLQPEKEEKNIPKVLPRVEASYLRK